MSAPGTSWTHGYTYDNAGNLRTRLSDAGNQQTLTFDPEGRLATVAENGQSTSYLYDADGNRLIRPPPRPRQNHHQRPAPGRLQTAPPALRRRPRPRPSRVAGRHGQRLRRR